MEIVQSKTKRVAQEAVRHARAQGFREWEAYECAKRYVEREYPNIDYDDAIDEITDLLEL